MYICNVLPSSSSLYPFLFHSPFPLIPSWQSPFTLKFNYHHHHHHHHHFRSRYFVCYEPFLAVWSLWAPFRIMFLSFFLSFFFCSWGSNPTHHLGHAKHVLFYWATPPSHNAQRHRIVKESNYVEIITKIFKRKYL
jgi:hypothetical protein